MTPCEPHHPADPEAFRVPPAEIERRTASIQEQLRRAGIDGLFIVQRVDLFYFSGTAQNGFLYLPAEGKPLLFIKQSVARARAESSVETIIAIDSVNRSGPDRRRLLPETGTPRAGNGCSSGQ